MSKWIKKHKMRIYYVLGAVLGLTAFMYPDKIEGIAKAFILFMGVSFE